MIPFQVKLRSFGKLPLKEILGNVVNGVKQHFSVSIHTSNHSQLPETQFKNSPLFNLF